MESKKQKLADQISEAEVLQTNTDRRRHRHQEDPGQAPRQWRPRGLRRLPWDHGPEDHWHEGDGPEDRPGGGAAGGAERQRELQHEQQQLVLPKVRRRTRRRENWGTIFS